MLPTAVALDKSEIPPALRAEVMNLAGPQPRAFTFQVALTWLVIAGTIATAEWVGTFWAYAIAVLVIATRQAQLFILGHEQVHFLAYKHRFGDLLVNLLCSFPTLFGTVEGYAQVHLAHHRHYFTDRDPDHRRKSGPEWSYPKPLTEILKLVARDVAALNFIRLIRGKRATTLMFARPGYNPRWARLAYLGALALTLTLTGAWGGFFLYWIVPLLTVLQVIIRWSAVCEHEYNRPGARVADSTPLIEPPWWQRALLPNLNFNLHVYHHYFPGVACNNLPRVHALFRKHGLVDEAAVFKGYGAYVRYLQCRPTPTVEGARLRRAAAHERA